MKRRTTIRDVAASAGVHYSTVSLALRNSPRIPKRLCQRIQKIAKRLNYIPDPMLSALNAYRKTQAPVHYQATIAWINNWPKKDDLRKNPTFNEYFHGALNRAKELGYELEEFWLHEPGMNQSKLTSILKARNIQGLLLAPQPNAYTPIALNFNLFSTLAFGYSLQPRIFHVVTNHQSHSMDLVLQKVIELGYRRIGLFVSSDWNAKVEGAWTDRLRLMELKNPLLIRVPPLHMDVEKDNEICRWIKGYKPDVIISFTELYKRLKRLKFKIPQEIGFAALSLPQEEKLISGVYQNNTLIGKTAMELMVGMIQRGEKGVPESPVRTLVESLWVPGKTLRKKRHAIRS